MQTIFLTFPGFRCPVLESGVKLPDVVIVDAEQEPPHVGAKFIHGISNDTPEVIVPELTHFLVQTGLTWYLGSKSR